LVKPTLKTLFILCVCLSSFVLHNSVFYGIVTYDNEETLPLAEATEEPESSDSHGHIHEHEDDMTSLDNITPHVLLGLASRLRGASLSSLSHSPNPLLPPPKSQ
jgi:hypothetical protein